MEIGWYNFAIVILVQFLLFIVHAHYEKRLREVPTILMQSFGIGLIFGPLFDLFVGKFVGVFSYTLGFTPLFLAINGILSYGLMQANALLMQRAPLGHFYVWSVLVGIVYEITNHFFRVWTWEFGSPLAELFIVHTVGYIGLAVLMALIWHQFLGHRFTFLKGALQRS